MNKQFYLKRILIGMLCITPFFQGCEKDEEEKPDGLTEPIVITFENTDMFSECGDVFEFKKVKLSVSESLAEDGQAGQCFLQMQKFQDQDALLMGGRFNIDVSQISGVNKVTIEFYDLCGVGCTRVFFYNGSTELDFQKASAPREGSFTFNNTAQTLDRFVLISAEVAYYKITIE